VRQLFKLRPFKRCPPDNVDGHGGDIDETLPWPPRWWWLKRLTTAYLLFVTCLALLYWAWTAYSHRQLAAAIAKIQARGEPVHYEDFDPPPISDDRNAAVALKLAAVLFEPDQAWPAKLSLDAQYNVGNSVRYLTTPQDLDVVQSIFNRRRPALALVRQSRSLEQADWNARVRKRMINILLPHLNGQRDLATFLAAAAYVQHVRGPANDLESLELCRDLLALGNHVGDNAPFGIVQHVDYDCGKSLADVVEQVAPTLDLTDTRIRNSARALIGELLDERRMSRNRIQTAYAERAFAADLFHGYIEGQGSVIEPAIRIDAARGLRLWTLDVDAAIRCSTYADFVQLVPEIDPPWQGGPPTGTPRWRAAFWRGYPSRLQRETTLTTTFFHNRRSLAAAYFRGCCDRRVAAALLAIRMHQLDHNGELPAKWDDLVPAHLPAAPRDPFAPGGQPIRLVRQGTNLILYSVAANLTDDGGAARDKSGRVRQRWQGATIDLVYRFGPPLADDAQ
jgi:hypothetical protein